MSGAERLRREARHSPLSNAEVVNQWNFPILPKTVFFCCNGSLLTVPFTSSLSHIAKAITFMAL